MTPALLAFAFSVLAQVPADWSCDDARFDDDTCDCGCTEPDSDCDGGGYESCVRDNCPDGQAPWADNSASCMASTCGDGWRADDEACDEGNSGADGGCNADCSAVNEGSICGEGASGCEGGDADSAGCAGAGLATPLVGLLFVFARRRRRPSATARPATPGGRVVSVLAFVAVGHLGACADSDCLRVDGGSPDAGGDDCDDGESAADAADGALEPAHVFEHLFP